MPRLRAARAEPSPRQSTGRPRRARHRPEPRRSSAPTRGTYIHVLTSPLWHEQRRTVEVGSAGELQAAGAGLALFVQEGTHTLQALDLRTGSLRWKRRLDSWRPGGSNEVMAGAGPVAVIDQGELTVLDARDGTPRWSKPLTTASLRAHGPAAILDGQLLVPSISSAWTPYDE